MIRDDIHPAARWRVTPESDEIAAQRVSAACGFSLAGLTFSVYASIKQLTKALEDGAGYTAFEEKCIANGGVNSKIWKIRVVAHKFKAKWSIWLWETPREITVLTVALDDIGDLRQKDKDQVDEVLGE